MQEKLYFIRCRWRESQNANYVHGFAVCSDPDTPVTFLYPDGKPYLGEQVWQYHLMHYYPWARLAVE